MNRYRIKEFREQSKLTQEELADKSGVSRSLISQLETGKRKRRQKKGSRVYIAPKPHIKPATLKLKDKAINNIKKHIIGGK